MRRALATGKVAAFFVFAAAAACASGAAARSSTCLPGRRGVVTADANVQIYVGPSIAEGRPLPEIPTYYGCSYARGRSYRLGNPASGGEVGSSGTGKFRLAGNIAAYEQFNTGVRFEHWVVVRNLNTGLVIHRLPTGEPAPGQGSDIGFGPIYSLVAASDGSVAWIAGSGGEYQVRVFDRSGARLIAAGRDIAPGSLALAGSTFYWTQAGGPTSSTLNAGT